MDTRSGLTRTGIALLASTLILAVSGCAAVSDSSEGRTPSPTIGVVQTTPLPGDTASASPSPAPFTVPPVEDGDIAGAVFDEDAGPDGTPVTTLTSYDAVESGVPFVVRGACVGESVGFRVLTAAVGESGKTLVEGTIPCAGDAELTYTVPFSGVVQLALTESDAITDAWVRMSAS